MSSVVPEGWEARELGDIAKFSGGSAFKEIYQGQNSGKYPFIKVSDMNLPDNNRYIVHANNWVSDEIRQEARVRLFPSDSIVFAKVGAALLLNRRRQLIRETAIDNNMMAAIPNACDPDFLYYSMQTIDLANIVQSGAVPSVNQSQMESIPTVIPPLPEQKKIASILTSVDEVIENTQKQIDKLQDLKKATMNELLTKGIGHTEFKDSELGRIPKSWEVGSLGEISTRVTDGTHQAVKTSDNGTIPFLYVSTVRDQAINWGIAGKITEDEYSKASQGRQPNLGDILYTAVGSYGYAAIVDTDSKFCFQRHIALIQLNQEVVSPKFIENFLVSDTAKRQADRLVVGNAQLTLTLGELKKFNVPLPPIHEQQTINNILNPLSECILRLGKKLTQTQSLKKSLMQDLLTGKVRVTVN